jgi:1-acyl-sn-glycerol-3-phosphate acyltransferase
MVHSLRASVRGGLSLLVVGIHTLLWAIPLYTVTIAKVVVPWGPWQRLCGRALTRVAELWIDTNNLALDLIHRIDWDVDGLGELRRNGSYLVNANHQSWTDVVVLQRVFNRRIPFLRFFLKQQLIWMPVLGLAWWALDMPFMKRYPREVLERHPELRGKDLETTRRSCQRLRHAPVTIMNFIEGTRFTPEKHRRQNSPYRNLLRPKAGGMAFVLSAMGAQLPTMLDVTIVYPESRASIWDFLCGRVSRMVVRVKQRPIPAELSSGDYTADPRFRQRFQAWVDEMWSDKDALIDRLLNNTPTVRTPGGTDGDRREPVLSALR